MVWQKQANVEGGLPHIAMQIEYHASAKSRCCHPKRRKQSTQPPTHTRRQTAQTKTTIAFVGYHKFILMYARPRHQIVRKPTVDHRRGWVRLSSIVHPETERVFSLDPKCAHVRKSNLSLSLPDPASGFGLLFSSLGSSIRDRR